MPATKPEVCEEKHLISLDRIREMGVCNMWGAADPLRQVYPELTKKQAGEILIYWIESYDERHPEKD